MDLGKLTNLTPKQHSALKNPNTDLIQIDKQSVQWPKFVKGKEVSLLLAVQTADIEPYEFGEPVAVWHLNITFPKHTRILPVKEWGDKEHQIAKDIALEMLNGVGDVSRWSYTFGTLSAHARRPLTRAEAETLDDVVEAIFSATHEPVYVPLPKVELSDTPTLELVTTKRDWDLKLTDGEGNVLEIIDDADTAEMHTTLVSLAETAQTWGMPEAEAPDTIDLTSPEDGAWKREIPYGG